MSAPEVCGTCEEVIAGGAENECELCNTALCSGCADDGYFETHKQTWQDPAEAVSLCADCTPRKED